MSDPSALPPGASLPHGPLFSNIQERLTAIPQAGPRLVQSIVMGVVWARTPDEIAVVVVVDRITRSLVGIDRMVHGTWDVQRYWLRELAGHWHPERIWTDSSDSAIPNNQILQAVGLPIEPFLISAASRANVIAALDRAIQRARDPLTIFADLPLLREMRGYQEAQRRYLSLVGYVGGACGEAVLALAIAWFGCEHAEDTVQFRQQL